MLQNLLLYRIIIVNALWLVFVGIAYAQGWVTRVIEGDSTGSVWIMVAVFVLFMISMTRRALKVTAGLNVLKAGGRLDINAVKFLEKNAHLEDFPTALALIGLLVNVLGIMIAFSSMNQGDLANASSTQQAISTLMEGMQIAFSATIAGGVLALWASVNCRILKTASVLLTEDAKGAAT